MRKKERNFGQILLARKKVQDGGRGGWRGSATHLNMVVVKIPRPPNKKLSPLGV